MNQPQNNTLPVLYLVDGSVAVTGAFISARNMARVLKNSMRVVLVLPRESTIPAEELKDFWRVDYLPIVGLSKRISPLLRYVPSLFIASWHLLKRMRNDGADALLLNDFYLMHGAVLRLFGFKGKIISWVRCDPKRFAGFLAQPILWLAANSANHIVAVSNYIRSLLPAHFSVQTIHNCYRGTPRTPRVWQPDDIKTFVYIGNYIYGKGQDIALQAFAVAAKNDSTLQLEFYGGDMGLEKNCRFREQLQAQAQQLYISDRVSFHDFHADTFSILERAFAALNFSFSESFSMTVLEASGVGVPVIATASGGPQEITQEGITAYIIPVGDVNAAADRMLTLAKNPDLAAKMGKAGAVHVQQHFSADALRSKLLSILTL